MDRELAPAIEPESVRESTGTSPPAVEVAHLSKTYAGGRHPAVDDLSLTVAKGEVLALLGPSGCGKTTALRLIAGLERPDFGTVEIAGRRVCGSGVWVPPEKRAVGMVFQDYALFPHLNVERNVAYGCNKLPSRERRGAVESTLALTGLDPYAKRFPHELSGGQQQRVAIARALAPRPGILLLDEPFSNLDVNMREQIRSDVLRILRAAQASVVLVTHDQDDAFVSADRVAVMSDGRLHQVGTPEEIYFQPTTRFVAEFVGVANFLDAHPRGGRLHTELGEFASAHANGACQVLLRPEQLDLRGGGVPATVVEREFHGHDWLYVLRTEAGTVLRTIRGSDEPFAVGQRVNVRATVATPPTFDANGGTG